MPIPPLPAAGALIAAAPLAQAAASGIAATFADLLAAASPRPKSAEADSPAPALGLEGLSGGLAAPPTVSSAAKLKAETTALLREFHDLLGSLLGDRGIESSAGFRLETATDGGVRVTDRHPESLRIEELFASHPELRQLFDRIVAQAGLLRASEQPAGARLHSSAVGVVVDEERASLAFEEH